MKSLTLGIIGVLISLNAMAVEWNQIVNGTFQAKSAADLFLARFAAYKHLADPSHSDAQAAEKFLLKTMTISKDAYEFEGKREFVKKVVHWKEPEILALRDTEDVRTVVYRIDYETSGGKDWLHEISFFKKDELGQYLYTHKYNLKLSSEMNTLTIETPIRQ